MIDSKERERLRKSIKSIGKSDADEDWNEESLLPFSHLKQIDRPSIRRGKKSVSSLNFGEDQIAEYE